MRANIESTRYLLLCVGILLVFFGSRTGQIVCLRVFNIVRSSYYLAIAILALCGALFFRKLGLALYWLARRMRKANPENPDVGSSKRDTI